MIRAEVHSDDMAETAKFDATPYFEATDDQSLLELAECGWGSEYAADAVARHVEDLQGYADVAAVFDHARATRGVGFEVSVHPGDALPWLRDNRPQAFARIAEALGIRGDLPAAPSAPHWDADASWGGDYAVPAAGTPSP